MTSRFAYSLLVALMLAGAPAWADVNRDQAVAAAVQVAGGRVLSVEKVQVGNRAAWRVKLVTAGGEVRVVMIDVATGRPL
ncbi:MAG: PepSY domain-containing protein [Rhodoferax sp.]|jgi:hypothetical protein